MIELLSPGRTHTFVLWRDCDLWRHLYHLFDMTNYVRTQLILLLEYCFNFQPDLVFKRVHHYVGVLRFISQAIALVLLILPRALRAVG